MSTGALERLTADSVYWRPSTPTFAAPRSASLDALSRLEVAERLSQRQALQRGLWKGGGIGALLGGGVLAVRGDAVGGAIGLTLAGAWLGGVISGQQVESPNPPVRWRVVVPPREQ